ncbi:GntR family transcriptional regulator [Actinophytocola sediminis]
MAKPPRITRSESAHQQIARHLRNDIAAGELRHGQPLPSTRELADEWDVSVFTINEAMKVLSEEGLVISKPRVGRVVHAPDVAEKERQRVMRSQLLLIGGYAGSGKTALGRIIARETGWPILDKDTLTRPVVEAGLECMGLSPNDRESEGYLMTMRPREYEALYAAWIENVECGNSAIVTAPFIREFNDSAWLNRVEATCVDLNVDVTIVWVYCDAESMFTYVRHRGAARDAAKLADWTAYLSSIDTQFRPLVNHHLIDNSGSGTPLQIQARKLLSILHVNRRENEGR